MLPNCKDCTLDKSRYVPPTGHCPKSGIAFVGEAPGRYEVAQGTPFVGESGQLLRACIRACARDPADFYYTNVCKCQPPRNRTPTGAERIYCSQSLWDEFREEGIEIIVPLGAVALETLGGVGKISKVHGLAYEIHVVDTPESYRVFPMYHPAAMLYNPGLFMEFAEEMEWLLAPDGPSTERAPLVEDYQVIEDPEEAIEFFRYLQNHMGLVAWDIETANTKVIDNDLLCVGFAWSPTNAAVIPADLLYDVPAVCDAFQAAAESPSLRWSGHNAVFDVARLESLVGVRVPIHHDSMLLHYCLNETRGTHGLKQLAMRYLRAPDWEADIRNYLPRKKVSYSLIPLDVLMRYNAQDAIFTYQLTELLRERVGEHVGLDRLYNETLIPSARTFARVTREGTRIDMPYLEELSAATKVELRGYTAELRKIAGNSALNIRSPKQLAHWFYDIAGAPTTKYSKRVDVTHKEGRHADSDRSPRTTAMDQLHRLAQEKYYGDELFCRFAQVLIKARHAQQFDNNFLKNYRTETDGFVHPNFLLHGTVTGRIACRRPNLMNMPIRGLSNRARRLIIPREGNWIVAADYGQAELRVLGVLAGSEQIRQIYLQGLDVHDIVGQEVYGADYIRELHRTWAKVINFGIAYGRGGHDIALALGVPVQRGHEIKKVVEDILGVSYWLREQGEKALRAGYVEAPAGRRRRWPLITERTRAEVARKAVNAPVQGTTSDIVLGGMNRIAEWIYDVGGHILFTVHDEIVCEVPTEKVLEYAKRIEADMVAAAYALLGTEMPFEAEAEVGVSFNPQDLAPIAELQEIIHDDSGLRILQLYPTVQEAYATWKRKQAAIQSSLPQDMMEEFGGRKK